MPLQERDQLLTHGGGHVGVGALHGAVGVAEALVLEGAVNAGLLHQGLVGVA